MSQEENSYWQGLIPDFVIEEAVDDDKFEDDVCDSTDNLRPDNRSVSRRSSVQHEPQDQMTEAEKFYKNWFFSRSEQFDIFKVHRPAQTDETLVVGIKELKQELANLTQSIYQAKEELHEQRSLDTENIIETLRNFLQQRTDLLTQQYRKDVDRIRRSFRSKLSNQIAIIGFNAETKRKEKIASLHAMHEHEIGLIEEATNLVKREIRGKSDEALKLESHVAKLQKLIVRFGLAETETKVACTTIDEHRVKQLDLLAYYQGVIASRQERLRQMQEQVTKQELRIKELDPSGRLMLEAIRFGKIPENIFAFKMQLAENFQSTTERIRATISTPYSRRSEKEIIPPSGSTIPAPQEENLKTALDETTQADLTDPENVHHSLQPSSPRRRHKEKPFQDDETPSQVHAVRVKRSEQVRESYSQMLINIQRQHEQLKQKKIDDIIDLERTYKEEYFQLRQEGKKSTATTALAMKSMQALKMAKIMFPHVIPTGVNAAVQCKLDD